MGTLASKARPLARTREGCGVVGAVVLGEAVADVGAVVALVAEKPDALLALLLCLLPMTRLPVLLLLLLFLWLLLLLLLVVVALIAVEVVVIRYFSCGCCCCCCSSLLL